MVSQRQPLALPRVSPIEQVTWWMNDPCSGILDTDHGWHARHLLRALFWMDLPGPFHHSISRGCKINPSTTLITREITRKISNIVEHGTLYTDVAELNF